MNIGILGGGIGGISTAIALKQEGFDVSIYERFSGPSTIGAGIVCWPNASFVLEQLGVLDEIANASGKIIKMVRHSATGDHLGTLDILKLNELMQFPSYSIIRKDLLQILTIRAVQLGIKIHYNHRVTSLKETKTNTVNVFFENGNHIASDVIIGADGRMNSMARKYVHGDNRPIYQNIINWIGVFESNEDIFDEMSVFDYWGVGERFGIVPVSSNKAYWAGAIKAEDIQPLKPETYKSDLMGVFKDWPSPITKIIEGTQEDQINKIYVHDQDPIQCWHKKNVILLGDSAHPPLPTSGQGACQALEDAWHLTNSLKANPINLDLAFVDYTIKRVHKTAGISLSGRQLAKSIFSDDKEYCERRNNEAKAMDYEKSVIGMAKGWANGLPIGL